MARSWDSRHSTAAAPSEANTRALESAVSTLPQWTVEDAVYELGSKSELAHELLRAKGMEVNKQNLASQRRSIDRWLAYETGSGSQARKPSKAALQLLNRVGRNATAAREGFDVQMQGDISVNGYRRPDRSATIHMQGPGAARFLANPTWESLAAAYGTGELHGYGNVLIDIQL